MMYQGSQNQKVFQKKSDTVVISLNNLCKTSTNTYDCLIVLNLQSSQDILGVMVHNATNIILADGGANSFYESAHRDDPKVRAVAGDFDSLKPEIEKYYKDKNVEMCRDQNQDLNDLEKCLLKAKKLGYKSVVCLGAMGSRLDHSLASMHIATKFGRLYPQMQVLLIGDRNLMYLLKPNQQYRIRISQFLEKKGCGLVPFYKANKIETTGLRWNLGKQFPFSSLEWGSFISTSNQILQQDFTAFSTDELFFVCSFKKIVSKL